MIINVTFYFPKFLSACEKSAHFINSFSKQNRFQSPMAEKATLSFDCNHPKIIKVALSCPVSICINLPKIKAACHGQKVLSFYPSFCLSFILAVFFELAYQFFSETLYGARGPYGDKLDRTRFFWNNSLSGKNDQKWSKMAQKCVFWTFCENPFISFV